MTPTTWAADAVAQNEPGWAKVIALAVAAGIFFIGTQVHKRVRAVREGKQINPFSPDAPTTPLMPPAEVKATLAPRDKGSRKGFGKWLRKG